MREDIVARIEKEIRSRFSEGIDLSPETAHFIESTFGVVSGEALEQLFSRDDADREMIADLLFSPGEALPRRLEGLLSPEGLSRQQRDDLAGRLAGTPLCADVRTAGGAVAIRMPPGLAEGFVDRLHLTRPVDAALAAAAAGRFGNKEARSVLSRLRAARLSGSEAETDALKRFFAARTPAHDDFWPLLNDLIGFLESTPAGGGLFDALVERKARCLQHLRQAAERDRSLRRYNVETLLVGGDRLPHVDAESLAMEIVRIDDLCRVLFGPAAPAPAGGLPLDMGRISSREDVDRLLRFFTEAENG